MTDYVDVLNYKAESPRGYHLNVDLTRLVASRMLIQSNSGGGKSRALRQLLEETHGRIQHLVIDPEGEFSSLRERFDYVLAAKTGADIEATPRTAKLLCRRLMETGASAVLDIYDLKIEEQREFVRIFLTELVSLPRTLWHPTLVVIDEAHKFAPEKGHGESVALESVIGLSSLGRKRGFCAVLATQRLSKLHKDAAAELLNKLIGRTGLDVDVDRAAKELGFDKEKRQTLPRLSPGQFYVYGPAIANEVTLAVTGAVVTTHPEAGSAAAPPPPATAKVRALLAASLADLPKEAAEEARSIDELRRQNTDLTKKLRQAERAAPAPVVDDKAIDRAVAIARKEKDQEIRQLEADYGKAFRELEHVARETYAAGKRLVALTETTPAIPSRQQTGGNSREARGEAVARPEKGTGDNNPLPAVGSQSRERPEAHRHTPVAPSGDLPKGERIVLIAIAQYDDGVGRDQLSVLTGYKRSSRDAYIQRLRERGYVNINGNQLTATQEGIAALGFDFEPLPTGDELRDYWLQRLPTGEKVILKALIHGYPEWVARDFLDEVTEYKRSSRDAYLQRLSSRRLVETNRGQVRASPTLFD